MHRHVLHNGAIHDGSDRLLSPGQVGFLNGWGVFSTLRIAGGVAFAFERHYARMRRDAVRLRVPFELTPETLLGQLHLLIEANQAFDSVLRVAVVRNRGGVFETPGQQRAADLVAFTAPLTDWGSGVHLTYVSDARYGASPFAGVKTTSWAQNLSWLEMAREGGFDEALLLDEGGRVSECTSANVFVIRSNQVFTPPLSTSGCLAGVTRAILLEEISCRGICLAERELSPSELETSDAVFITSTTRDLLPVLSVDHVALRQEHGVLGTLRRAFGAYRQSYTARRAIGSQLVQT